MTSVNTGRFRARITTDPADVRAAQALRAFAFGLNKAFDTDAFDTRCAHILIQDTQSGALVATFRMLDLTGEDVSASYAAQYYDLSGLQGFDGRMVEMGRFCIDSQAKDPDVLRLAWAAMTSYVDQHDVKLLFGCSSFAGTKPAPYLDAFAVLKAQHLAPKRWLPQVKAPEVFRFAACSGGKPDLKKAMVHMPPLLRTYLMMGGWVSDHAVVDHQMNTLHVFTGVEIGAIPATRKRLLRALG